MATPSVGCRVRILKDYATVRYIGPVAKQEGTWVGVEWDDPSRGKHDGSTGGIRYFECKASGNAGSFVRIERVSFGVSVLEALRARYNNETAEHGEEVKEDELYVHTSRNRRVRVQLVGEEKIQQKQRQIHALESARLVGLDVAFVDAASALSSSLPALTSLDLTCNLLTNWAAVEQLATALPNLSALNLSENRIQIQNQIPTTQLTAEEQKETAAGEVQPAASTQNTEPSAGEAAAAAALAAVPAAVTAATTATALLPKPSAVPRRGVLLPGLQVLVLNDCGISWQDVLQVAPQLPSLQELHCCGNSIPSLYPAPHPRHRHSNNTSRSSSTAATTTTSTPPPTPALPALQQEAEGQQPVQQATTSNQTGGSPQQQQQQQQSQQQGQEGNGSGGGQVNEGQSECDDGDDEAAAELLASLFPRLQVLTLEEVGLRGWSQLLPLRRLPALTRLHLAGNPRITHVRYPDAAAAAAAVPAAVAAPGAAAATASQPSTSSPSASDSPAAAAAPDPTTAAVPAAAAAVSFPRLTALFVGGCGIADWGSVNQLDRFPELKEVRLTGNPVLALSRTGGRFEVIGRVSRLRHLNGAEVRPRERRDSELRYLQHIAAEMEAAAAAGDETSRAAVRAAHPRLRALMEVYGSVLATASRGGPGGPGGSLAASTVELKLTCVAAAAQAKMGTQVKKLPRSTTVSALRLLCERLFKVPADRMALFLRAPGDPLPEDLGGSELEDRPLAFFGVQAGHEVLVDEVDPCEVRAAGERSRQQAAAAHEQRLAEQLRAAERMQAEVARNMGVPQQ